MTDPKQSAVTSYLAPGNRYHAVREIENRSEEVAISQPSDTGTATAEKQAAH